MALYTKKNIVEAATLFSKLSPNIQDSIIEMVKTLELQNQNKK